MKYDMLDGIINTMSLEELVGQVMCESVLGLTDEQIDEKMRTFKPGSVFTMYQTPEFNKKVQDIANSYCKVPVAMVSDIENGPGSCIKGLPNLPHPMAWGATDNEALIEEAGEETAKLCRLNGIHWTFGPIVDLNINPSNPECNIRSVSDNPDRVIKIVGAHLRGLTKNGYMVTSIKHFPGQGADDRNSHFCTTINGLSKKKWMKTYGLVYKDLIKQGTSSIMIGHTSLPFCEKKRKSVYDYPPATVSKNVITHLLKDKLKYGGCVMSDAVTMVGMLASVPADRRIIEFFKAGGDAFLYPKPIEYEYLTSAVKSGEIPLDRLKDAVRRNLMLKVDARLFEDQDKVESEIKLGRNVAEISRQIADESIKVVRNECGVIPARLKKGARVAFVNMPGKFFYDTPDGTEFKPMREVFEQEGCIVDEYVRGIKEPKSGLFDYDLVIVNCRTSSRNYHGGSMRIGWGEIEHAMPVFENPNLIFVSHGDPYKLHEFHFARQYINTFSVTDDSQRAVAKVILGKIAPRGKNPVSHEPFFKIEN